MKFIVEVEPLFNEDEETMEIILQEALSDCGIHANVDAIKETN